MKGGAAALGTGALGNAFGGCTRCGGRDDHSSDHETATTERRAERDEKGVPTPVSKPNIVYILVDQHRGDTLGAAGHPVVKTPHLDRLAARGVTFGRCYTNGPLCRPSRASMMTGRYVHEHRVWHNFVVAPPESPSHVRRIRDEAGYLTAVIGKTHLHRGEEHLDNYRDVLQGWGFEDSLELTAPGQAESAESAYSDWLSTTTPPDEKDKFARLKDYLNYFGEHFLHTPWAAPPLDDARFGLAPDDHLDTFTGRQAARWIRDRKGDKPFYLQVNFHGPHDPYDAPSTFRDLYKADDSKLPPGILRHPEKPQPYLVKASQEFMDITAMTTEQHRQLQLVYYAKTSLVDAAIGEVLTALEESGQRDNTWVIFGADHGEMLGDHYLVQKTVFYEQSVHVPLIVSPPVSVRGWRSQAMVDQLDVTSTILDIAGLEVIEERGESVLKRIGAGSEDPLAHKGRDWVLSENLHHGMLRTDRYKLVGDYRRIKEVEFYDLEADPHELNNLVADSAYSKPRLQLAELMGSIVPRSALGRRKRRRRPPPPRRTMY